MKHATHMLNIRKIVLASICITHNIQMLAFDCPDTDLSLDQKIGQLFMAAAISNTKSTCAYSSKLHQNKVDTELFSLPIPKTIYQPTRQPDATQAALKQSPYRMDRKYIEYLITNYHIGGIIFMRMSTPEEQKETTQHFQQLSTIPLLIGQDLEWGLSMRLKNVVRFPRAMTLGALAPQHEQLIYDVGYEIGSQCKALGVHINFAPVADVNNNSNNPVINTRSFGQDAESVARKSMLFAHGMQDAGIIACAKHFPGHGDTDVDSHHALPIITHTQKRLEKIELYPFQQLIKHNIQAIMVAHLEIPALELQPDLPASLSHTIVTKLLRNTLGFNGLIVTDGLGMRGVTNQFDPGDIELRALLAGHDILVAPTDIPRAHAAIKNAILDGTFSEEELDARVAKILRAKYTCGAITQAHLPEAHNRKNKQLIKTSDKKLDSSLNSAYAQQLSERAYQAAITLVKNNNTILPLKPSHLSKTNNRQASTPLPLILVGQHENHDFTEILSAHTPTTIYQLTLDATTQKIEQLFDLLLKKFQQHAQNNKTTIITNPNLAQPQTNSISAQITASYNKAKPIKNHPTPPTVIISSCQKYIPTPYPQTTENTPQNNTAILINLLHAAGIRTIVVAYETPYNLAAYENADALICAHENTAQAHTAAINTLLGNHNPSGILPVTVSDFWPIGWGLHYSH